MAEPDDDKAEGVYEMLQLTPAYLFDCPNCGVENFQRTVSRYYDPSDHHDAEVIERELGAEELADALDLQTRVPSFRMVCSTNPRFVVCKSCTARFGVLPPDRDEPFDGDDDLDDDDDEDDRELEDVGE